MSKRTIRATLGAFAVVLATAGVGWLGVGAASAAGGPHIVVTPHLRLHNRQVVEVRGSGFKPGDSVYIVECLRNAKGQAQCYVPMSLGALPKAVTITASGALPTTRFIVRTGKIGSGVCGTTKVNLARCAVSVGNATGGDSTSFPITFVLPKKK